MGYTRTEKRAAQRTLLRLLDEAVERGELTPIQRVRFGLRFRFKPDDCCGVLEALAPEVAALEGVASSEFGRLDDGTLGSAGGLFEIDVDKLEQLLQLLIKYLPQIIEIITSLFG